jgi:glucose-6-phosphate 1-dehydrogenase
MDRAAVDPGTGVPFPVMLLPPSDAIVLFGATGDLARALRKASRPLHYLAIPPSLFAPVVEESAVHRYQRGSWGPVEADRIVERHGSWHDPAPVVAGAR